MISPKPVGPMIAAAGFGLALLFFVLATLLSPALYGGLGLFGGVPNTATRQLAWDGGDRLELDMSGDVTLVPGGAPALILRGDPAAIQDVALRHGRISAEDRYRCPVPMICGWRPGFQVELHGVTLHEINIEGSGDVALGAIHQDRLALTIEGSGGVSGSGEVGDLSVHIEGSGDGHLARLNSNRLDVELEGSGDVRTGVTNHADISISGSGDVRLAGAMPADINAQISGSGAVTDSEGGRITRRSQKRMRQS